MFVQVMEGVAADREGLRRQWQRWVEELRPGASGYVGTTGGIAPDGRVFLMARFESEEAARANSDRPEQGAWWSETEKCFDGAVTFCESTDVESYLKGGSDEAGFVQVMKFPEVDRARMAEMDAKFLPALAEHRPELIGGLRVWTGASSVIEVNYFTTEEAARAGERKDLPPELTDAFGEFEEMMQKIEFIDLPDPMLASA